MFYKILSSYIEKNSNPKITFLSGWGQRSDIINLDKFSKKVEYLDYLFHTSVDPVFDDLKSQNPDIIIGWSLGGIIAINSIVKQITKPKLLILLATPFQFLSQDSYKIGVGPEIYQSFNNHLSKNPEKLLRKFHLMMLQDDKRFLELKNKFTYSQNFDNLQYWLDYLINFSALNLNFNNFCQTELIYGENDKIVNLEQGKLFNQKILNSQFNLVKKSSNIPFL